MCRNLNLDATEILNAKLAVSAKRYPVERARGKNLKYTQLSHESDA